jgi:hypothetical protein
MGTKITGVDTVSKYVNKAGNEGEKCVEPVEEKGG